MSAEQGGKADCGAIAGEGEHACHAPLAQGLARLISAEDDDAVARILDDEGSRLEAGALSLLMLSAAAVRARITRGEREHAELTHLRTAMAASRLGLWKLNLATGVLDASATCKANFGRRPEEPFDYDALLAAIHPDDRGRMEAAVQEALATGRDYDIEYRCHWPDGAEHAVHVCGRVQRDEGGQPAAIVGTSSDVTARFRAEAALRELNDRLEERVSDALAAQIETEAALRQAQKMEAIGRLTGGIAHDFNNLLTPVIGGLELIAGRTEDPRLKRLADNALEAGRRGAKLAGQLLSFSRTQRLETTPVDVNRLVDGLVELIRSTIGPAIAVRTRLDRGICPAWCDAHQLENAILNLAINARDAMPEGGMLTIATTRVTSLPGRDHPAGDYLALSVADTGTGMSPEVVQRAMEPFFTTKPVGEGTGLGLAQVYGLARRSGGTLQIESREAVGTTMCLLLPVADDMQAPAEVDRPYSAAADGHLAGTHILVVDDDRDVRAFLCETLAAAGCTVAVAADGVTAIALLERNAPDVLLVDLEMPGIDGLETASRARARAPGLPVILAAGNVDDEAIRSTSLQDVVLLPKPFEFPALHAAIAAALPRVGV